MSEGTIKKNGLPIGSASLTATGKVTFNLSSPTTLAVGDVLGFAFPEYDVSGRAIGNIEERHICARDAPAEDYLASLFDR